MLGMQSISQSIPQRRVQGALPLIQTNPSAQGFSAHFGNGYAHGIVVIPQEVSGVCEVRDQFDQEYVYQALYRRGKKIDTNDPKTLARHLPFLRRARGHVLVSNVGLGGFLYRLVRKPGVVHITVVEPDFDVLELIEPAFSKFADKVTFVHGSVESTTQHERFDQQYIAG